MLAGRNLPHKHIPWEISRANRGITCISTAAKVLLLEINALLTEESSEQSGYQKIADNIGLIWYLNIINY